MDPNFAFPRATPRPQPVQPPSEPVNRASNALRASVLDAALELGLGTNKTVANWMFNNTLDEEEEEHEEDLHTRAPLSPTSEESAPYSTPPTSTEWYSEAPQAVPPSPHVQFPDVPAVAPTATAAAPNKLRKQRRENGYESDGGYVSDGGKKTTFRARTKSKPKAPDPAVVYPISEPMELIPMTKEERKRQKKAAKGGKDNGAETDTEDVPKLSKSKSTKKTKKGSTDAGAGYETDDGYVSSSGKSKKGRRFFGLRRKNDSASEPMPEPMPVPPMPEREVFDLPIASRFATTLPPSSAAPSAPPSRAETPLAPPSRRFASASGSSSPSVSSATSSLLTPADQETFPASPRVGPLEDEITAVSPHQKSPSSGVTPTEQQPKSKFFSFGRKDNPDSPPKAPKQTPAPILLSPNTNGGLNSRSPSPMGSPFVLLTPISTNNGRAPSPAPSASTEVVASTDFVVPSRSTSPLPPSPNVLSYYDVPPPSPPPTGPLPRLPPPSAMRESPGPGVARLRSMSRDRINPGTGGRLSPLPPDSRSVSPGPWSANGATSPLATSPMTPGSARSPLSPIQRGRASPFPAQPILQTRQPNNGLGPGLADRVKVERYRDLYALNIDIPDAPRVRNRNRDADETSVNIEVDEGSDGEDDAEIAGVLGRFRESTARERDGGNAVALERNNSAALRAGGRQRVVRFSPEPSPTREAYWEEDDDASRYPDDERTAGRRTMYRFDNGSSDGEGGGVRDTVYSERSRASFMDVSKSEAARGRLVDRIGVMYDQNGRELQRSPVPPVPRLPPELLAGANRF